MGTRRGTKPASDPGRHSVRVDATLERRAHAARELVAEGRRDPHDALFFVAWPTERLARGTAPERRSVTVAEYQEMRRLTAEGLSRREVAERLDRPKSTVTQLLGPRSAGRRVKRHSRSIARRHGLDGKAH